MAFVYAPNQFTPQPYAMGYPAISAALVEILDDLLTSNSTPAMVYERMPLVRSNPLTDEWRKVFMPEAKKIHFWIITPNESGADKINMIREEDNTRRTGAHLIGYYGYSDPGPNLSNNLELSLPIWEQIVRTVLSRLQTGDENGYRTLNNTCLTYKAPESIPLEIAQFSAQVTTHMITIPIVFEEAYLWAQ